MNLWMKGPWFLAPQIRTTPRDSREIPTFSFMVPLTKSSILISLVEAGHGHRPWTFKTGCLGKWMGPWSEWSQKTYGALLLSRFHFIHIYFEKAIVILLASCIKFGVVLVRKPATNPKPCQSGLDLSPGKGDLHYKLPPMISYTKSVKPDSGHFHLQHLETQPTKMCIFQP